MTPEHLGPHEAAWPSPEEELEDIELGDRVAWWFLMLEIALMYSLQEDRIRSVQLMLVGQVAEATSHRGLPFPSEWWPAEAGPLPTGAEA